ncbi:MAG TPA: exopolysaccharide biosynthesis polyprenyl glycosylphosphotransferase [Candidatus Didemnitutus sp.]|nr:exopolysaccharide biosynthesis polyprenyl glycosylphosphotransferase [Candidatus Didemnitutus sp.]
MNDVIAGKEALFLPSDAAARGRRGAVHLLATAIVGDTIVIYLSLAAASWIRFAGPLAKWGDPAGLPWTAYMGHVFFGTALFSFLCVHFQVYTFPQMMRFRQLASRLLRASCIWGIAYIALAYLLHFDRPLSRLYLTLAFCLATSGLLAWRFAFHRWASKAAALGHLRQRVAFVDWSPHAATLAEALVSDRRHLYEIVGCVPPAHAGYSHPPPARMRQLGAHDTLHALLQRHEIDTVIMADLNPPDGEMTDLATRCEKEMVEFKVIPSCFQSLVSGLHLETVRGIPVLGVSRLPLDNPFNSANKQIVDTAGSMLGLVLSAPLIALFGLLVYLESPGPIFYRQQRLGRDGRPFWLYKLRSMRPDAERDGKVGWTRANDPRRLRVGAFMRRWNIDETPQFWNVLRGDMSLVGPRPERPELIVNFKESIPHYNARHNIKPGITGWAQVNGYRGDTDLTERVRHDLHYIENWSVLFDVQIMLQTFFRQKNAC